MVPPGGGHFWIPARDHFAVLDVASGRVIRDGDLPFEATDVDFSPDGRHVALTGGPRALQILDVTTGGS